MMASSKSKKLEARYVGTLVYLDEPHVVLLDHGDDAKIIGVAIEKEGFEFPFLGAEISFNQLINYQRELVDLRNLFLVPRWRTWYLFDLGKASENGIIPLQRASKHDYRDEENLPAPQFFARNHTQELVELPTANLVKQKYLIDGTWLPPDLSLFFGRINDLYSFFLGIRKFLLVTTTTEQKHAFIRAFSDHPLRGGSSYVGLYGSLKGLVSFEERLAMGGIKKESPGYVDVEGRAEVLSEVLTSLKRYARNADDIGAKYRELRTYLSKMGLLKVDPERFDPDSPVAAQIRTYSVELALLLGVNYEALELLTSKHILISAKILLSHYRRLERYNLFFVEGRVRLPDGFDLTAADMPEEVESAVQANLMPPENS